MSSPIAEKLQQAFGCFNARDLAGTERLCVEILRAVPHHPDALHLLGVVRMVSGKPREAVSFIDRALRVTPGDAALQENLGMARAALGDYRAAEAAFRQALALGASHAVLHMRLGLALGAQGKLADAVGALRTAATLSPDDADVQLNLGNTLAESGQTEEALACYRKVLALKPDHATAHFNVGNLYRSMGRLEEAEASFRQAVTAAPDDPDIHNNLGLLHELQSRLEDAESSYQRALALHPGHLHARSNLGNVLRMRGRLDEAAASCEGALALQPDFFDALVNLGNVRAAQFRLGEAQALYERALRVDPRNADAHRNLAALFASQGRMDEAVAGYRKAVECAPGLAIAHIDLGDAYLQSGNLEQASACFRKALGMQPDSTGASYKLAETLKLQGSLDEAAGWYQRTFERAPHHLLALNGLIHVQQHMCNWDGFEERWKHLQAAMGAANDGQLSPFSVLSLPTTAAEQLACAVGWARRHIEPLAAARSALGIDFSRRHARDKLRIGYLAWGFHRHATGYWTPELLELHDRTRCEVFAYSYGPDDGSEIRARIRAAADRFVEISRESHLATARRIYDDGIDVLVDLTGYTFGTRSQVLALRPAPVQVNWFYPGTMGTACVDYFIADPVVVPAELEPFFTEKIVRLPDCYMITDRKRPVTEQTPTRAECGLPDEAFVFCCFNQAYKILPDVFASWMRIVKAVPGSVLWLLECNRWATDNLRRAATEHGVAGERIVIAPHRPMPEHLARYRLADLALDTFPYTSHTTAADALWVGCPLVTRLGKTFASRVAGSVLINAGLRELVADDADSCEQLAMELASSPGKLQNIRRRLQEYRDSCPLFDTPRFVRNLERAYEEMSTIR